MTEDESLNRIFAALADPTRRAIIERLAKGILSVNELAEPFKMTAPAITKHLKVLEDAGLIKRSRVAQTRPCELQVEPLNDALNWIASYRQGWEQSLDNLDTYLKKLQETTNTKEDPHGKRK